MPTVKRVFVVNRGYVDLTPENMERIAQRLGVEEPDIRWHCLRTPDGPIKSPSDLVLWCFGRRLRSDDVVYFHYDDIPLPVFAQYLANPVDIMPEFLPWTTGIPGGNR